MGRLRLSILFSLTILFLGPACFRESTVEQAPTTSTQTTQANLSSLAIGSDALGQNGDFVLENATLQVVVNGNTEDLDRRWFLEKNAGSIWDISTRFESAINRQLFSRNDDGLNQLTQGVNMNRHTLVSYHRVTINPIDRNIATLTMSGRIFDLDGSLEAAGAAVDASTRALLNCEVETVLEVRNAIENPNTPETNFRVFYLSLTTVVSNTGEAPLPIYTVNDIVVTQRNAFSLFVPYPDWGFARPDRQPGQHAYAPFLQFQPRQLNTAHYGFTSRTDGLLMADEERLVQDQIDITYVGKISQPSRTLAPGDAMTFVRECFALNGLNSDRATFLTTQASYGALVDLLSLNPMSEDLFNQTGLLTLNFRTNLDQDGSLVIELNNTGINYYNGSGYVPLEDDRFFPIFGTNPLFSNYSNLSIPVGQVRFITDLANGDPIIIDEFIDVSTDADGNQVTTVGPINILMDSPLTLQRILASPMQHGPVRIRILNESNRILFGHAILSEADGSNDIVLGELPDKTQGRVIYIDSIDSNSLFLPEGEYILSASHGPRFGLNSPTISVATRVVPGSDPEVTAFSAIPSSITYTLSEQVPLPGYLAADFDVRTSNDTAGLINMRDLVRFGYSEDLDILFAADSRNPSEIETEFRIVALGLGALDAVDLDAQITSFFDEIAVARAIGTYGRRNQAPKKLGRFALFNLPKEDAEQDFFTPNFDGDPAGFYDRVREADPNVIIQVSRPRSPVGLEAGLFTAMAQMAGLDANTPLSGDSPVYRTRAETGSQTRWIDFDLLQVLSGNQYQEYLLSREDWFGLLNEGIFKPATGGTLPGEVKDLPLGTVRTYVKVDDTILRDIDLQPFWEAAKEGRSFVTNGPIIEADINGASYGDSTTNTGTVTLNLKVSASDWIPVDEIRVVVNGVVQDIAIELNQDSVIRYEGQIPLTLATGTNHWVVIEAGAALDSLLDGTSPGRQFWRAYPGHKPVAFTNPIFIGSN